MTERRSRQSVVGVDLLQKIQQPDFQQDVGQINTLLATYSDTDEPKTDLNLTGAAQKAIDSFNQKHFGPDWVGREIKVTVACKNEKGQLGVEALSGAFIGADAEYVTTEVFVDNESGPFVKEVGQRALRLWFENDTTIYTLPLNGDRILAGTVQMAERQFDADQPLRVAQNSADILAHLLTTEQFLNLSLILQRKQIFSIINEIESQWEVCTSDKTIYTVAANQSDGLIAYDANQLSIYLPGLMERTEPYTSVEDYEDGPELWVEMTLNEGEEHRVPLRDIIAVTNSNDADKVSGDEAELTRTDILAIFTHNSDATEILDDIEYHLNYSEETMQDEVMIAGADDLYELLPVDFFEATMQIRGNVFTIAPNGSVKMAMRNLENAKIIRFDAIAVSGSWRVALQVAVDADNQDECEIVYVVPTEEYLQQFDSIDYSAIDSDVAYETALVHEFKDAAEYTQKLLGSRRFRRGRLNQQLTMLQSVVEPLDEMVTDMMDAAPTHSRIACSTDEYYVYSIDDDNQTYAELAVNNHVILQNNDGTRTFQIEGDNAAVIIPELGEDRTRHFTSMQDFPLSKGQPMLIIQNEQNRRIYLIPGAKISSLATVSTINNDN